jgi:hypothetical protein
MIACIALLVAAQQTAPTEPEVVQDEVHYGSVISEVDGSQIIYHFEDIDVVAGEKTVRADRAIVRLDRENYQQAAEGSLLLGDLATDLIGLPGKPVQNALILEIRLEGGVRIDSGFTIIECDWLSHSPPRGVATLYQAQITVPAERSPNLWPWRMQAKYLQEFPDGVLRAKLARLTACHLKDPVYSMAIQQLIGTPDGRGEYNWKPTTPWLEVGSRRLMPMPAFQFNSGEDPGAGFGLRSFRISSGKQLGTAVEVGFAASTEIEWGKLDYRLLPMFSTRRGFPMRAHGTLTGKDWKSDWDLFALNDNADDVHRLRRFAHRDNDFRWRVRWDNRFTLADDWELDLDLALTSDPIVDPEFFRSDWINNDDALSEIYLRKNQNDSHFSLRASYRLDDAGYTPLGGYGRHGGPIAQQLDLLPRARYDHYSATIAHLPTGPLGGSDGRSALNFAWGFDVGRFQLRSLGIAAPPDKTAYTPVDDEVRDRARLWSELAIPMNVAGVSIRPGVRADVGAVRNASSGGGNDEQGAVESFVETSMVFEGQFADGWMHRVRPMIRLRNLQVFDRPDANWYAFEPYDTRRSGQAAEMSVRQLWYGKNQARPWLDLDLLAAYYPDTSEPLYDELFPSPRDSQPAENWGPGELRLVWDPGVERGILRGVRTTSHLRYRFDSDHLEEHFSQISISPNPNWRLTLQQRHWDPQELPDFAFRNTTVQARWRINPSFEFHVGRTFQTSGNSTTSSRLGMTYYGHGFAFEFYSARNDVTGEQRFGVNLLPCFLTQPFYQEAVVNPGVLPTR